MFSKTEMSEVLTEIVKMDPNFDKEIFINDCKTDIIPNVLEVQLTTVVFSPHVPGFLGQAGIISDILS